MQVKNCVNTSSAELSDDLHIEKMKCCGILASNRKAMPDCWKENKTEVGRQRDWGKGG
jgi:hypothetical protein